MLKMYSALISGMKSICKVTTRNSLNTTLKFWDFL